MIARNDKAAVVLFFFSVSAMDILETNNETESCINPVVGYNIADENFTAVNTLQDVTEKSDVNVSGLWIFPFPLPRKNTLINSILKYFFLVAIPSIRTPATRKPNINQLNLPTWALSLWNIGQSIITYTAGVGTVVLATCCLNIYKHRKKESSKPNEADVDNDLGMHFPMQL